MDRRSNPEPTDLSLSASPAAIRRRALERLLPVRSLWFASPADQRAWQQAGVPLYVLRDNADPEPQSDDPPWTDGVPSLEVGPRLASLWASCFAPALEGRFVVDGDSTTVKWRMRWPRPTLVLVIGWWVVLVGWAVAILTGRTEGQPAVFWIFLVLTSTVGPWLGWTLGGQALYAAWPVLKEALEQPDVDEDW